jgi:hypothetical protein
MCLLHNNFIPSSSALGKISNCLLAKRRQKKKKIRSNDGNGAYGICLPPEEGKPNFFAYYISFDGNNVVSHFFFLHNFSGTPKEVKYF